MARITGVTGLGKVIRNLTNSKIGLGKELERGLIKAGLFLQRESQLIVPIDTSNLKNSAFTRKKSGTSGLHTEVRVGYTANYAIYVHEDLDAQHTPGKIAKYLERPAREKKPQLQRIIADELRGKK